MKLELGKVVNTEIRFVDGWILRRTRDQRSWAVGENSVCKNIEKLLKKSHTFKELY